MYVTGRTTSTHKIWSCVIVFSCVGLLELICGNVRPHRAAHPTELRIPAKTQPPFLPPPIPPPPDMESLAREDRIVLAVQLLKSNASLSVQGVAARFYVPKSTLQTRRARTTARRNTYPNSSKLTKIEELSLVKHIRSLSLHRFALTYREVHSIANQLLAVQGGMCVSNN
jgi:hypothetical protein